MLWYANAPGFAQAALVDSEGGDSEATAKEVALEACASLRFRITDSDAQPVSGVRVAVTASIKDTCATNLSDAEFELAYNGGPNTIRGRRSGVTGRETSGDYEWTARTDSTGEGMFPCLPPDVDLLVAVVRKGHVVLEIPNLVLQPGAEVHEWALAPETVVRAELVDEAGAPIADRRIWLVDAREDRLLCPSRRPRAFFTNEVRPYLVVTSDREGIAVFEAVPQGEWYLGPAPDDEPVPFDSSALASVGALVRVEATDAPATTRVVVDRGAYVAGLARDCSRSPQVGLTVQLGATEVCGLLVSKTDAAGRFVLGPLPRTSVLVTASSRMGARLASVETSAEDHAVVLEIPSLVALSVTVLDGIDHVPTAIESLSLYKDVLFQSSVQTGNKGTMRLPAMPAGTYTLVARTVSGKIAIATGVELSGDRDQHEQTLTAHFAGNAELVNDSDALCAVFVYLGQDLIDYSQVSPAGRERRELPPGPLRFEMKSYGGLVATRNLVLSAGEPALLRWP
jgi:hypothetical protein